MFGSIGGMELVVIVVIALLVFGPRKLPELGRTIGKGLNEFKRASNDLKRSLDAELDAEDFKVGNKIGGKGVGTQPSNPVNSQDTGS